MTGQQQPREQLGVLAIGLDPVARGARRLARRRHEHLDPGCPSSPRQPETARARLIGCPYRRREVFQLLDDRLDTGAEARSVQLAAEQIDRRSVRRACVHVQANNCHGSVHRTLLCLGSAGASLRPDKPPYEREGPAYLGRGAELKCAMVSSGEGLSALGVALSGASFAPAFVCDPLDSARQPSYASEWDAVFDFQFEG